MLEYEVVPREFHTTAVVYGDMLLCMVCMCMSL